MGLGEQVAALKDGDDVTVVINGHTYRGIARDNVDHPGHLILPQIWLRMADGTFATLLESVEVNR